MSSPTQNNLTNLKKSIDEDLRNVSSHEDLLKIRKKYLGRKGILTELIKELPQMRSEKRTQLGKLVNQIKKDLESQLIEKSTRLPGERFSFVPTLDISLPGERPPLGTVHPITKVKWEAEKIFQKMGFSIYEPRLVDNDFHNFTALNMPRQHPAREMWDTFWTQDELIPITHTSSMQHRILKNNSPPIAAIVPGRCFRHEATDSSHEHTFYQIEGVYLDQGITLADLIGTLKTFLETFFARELKTKIQPSFFPFVEPGLEILIDCVICLGKGCSVCKKTGWLELVPAGPIHPNVLKIAGVNHKKYRGFAWGLGLDRLTMLRYKIDDIRWFHSGDLRFLRQF